MPNAPLTTVLAGMNSIGLFASRAFVSAFAIAAMLRWGPQIDLINNTGLLQQITNVPSWFTHDITLWVLGALAALEIAASKSADARALMNEVDGYLKSGTAFVTTLVVTGIINAEDAAVIDQITAWVAPAQAGLVDGALSFITASMTAAGVWFTCTVRRSLIDVLSEADPDDDTKVMSLLSWAEDIWALFGVLLLVLFPLFMMALTAAIMGVLAYLHRRARRIEEQSKTPCTQCDQTMYRCALACPNCKQPNPEVHAIGWLGQSLQTPTKDAEQQPVQLAQKQRCPVCATHLDSGRVRQACKACGHISFETDQQIDTYMAALNARLSGVLALTAGLSLIPIVGLIPAVIVYRLRLIAPLRRYLSTGRNMLTRWMLRLLFFVLIWVQAVPGVGALAVPIMALVSYGMYRRAFARQLDRERTKAQASA